MATDPRKEHNDDTISRVTVDGVEVQALSRSARQTTLALRGHERSPGLWQVPCSSHEELVTLLEELHEAGFRLGPEARAGVAKLAGSRLCRDFADRTIGTPAFCQGFMTLVYDVCAVEPLKGDYLELFSHVEEWETAVGSQRADAEERLRTVARHMAA